MKLKVTYYDIDVNKVVEKTCFDFETDNQANVFVFTPIDEPVKQYKSVCIDHPNIQTYWNNNKLKIIIEGYQLVKQEPQYGYWKTRTTIESVSED